MVLLFDLIHAFREHKVLPHAGGWLDQAESFKEVCQLFSHVERMCNEKQKEMSDRINKMANRGKING